MWEEGPSGELVIVQKLLVPKESHVVSRSRLERGTKALLGRGSPLHCLGALRAGSGSSLLSHSQKILIGPKGHLISQIAEEAGRDLMDIFLCEVQLRLSVKLLN